ncbi:MAG: DinB family protein [Phycisphaerae bacterium]
MQYNISEAVNILTRTPRVVRTMLADLPEPWVMNNYGQDTWSPFDIVGHLIHGERTDWIPRARIILDKGEEQPFEPFDRFAQYEDSKGKSMADLLSLFEELREQTLHDLKLLKLDDAMLARTGTHPALGTVKMSELLAAWVAHDLNHIAQISKALAFQYAEEVGPWRQYLSILRPPNPA